MPPPEGAAPARHGSHVHPEPEPEPEPQPKRSGLPAVSNGERVRSPAHAIPEQAPELHLRPRRRRDGRPSPIPPSLLPLAFALLAAGCAAEPGPPALTLRPVAFDAIPGWREDRVAQALPALLAECEQLGRLPADTRLGGAGAASAAAGTAGLYRPACQAARALPPADEAAMRAYLRSWFLPYEVGDNDVPDASFAGYYEPEIQGALAEGPGFTVPVHARPPDLVGAPPATPGARPAVGRVAAGHLVPYWSRADIDRGALGHRNLEILWLRSAVDLFFLQVQGAGRVRLPSGQIVRLGYAGGNGLESVPLGRILVEQRQLAPDAVTTQSVRDWLDRHPAQAQATLERNPNYVFFRVLDDVAPNQGPPGALGVDLVPLRSAAVDRAFLPLGVPLFVETTLPSGAAFDRLVLAQDLGGDVSGPTRADLFLGWGGQAARDAGALQAGGRIVVLLPRQPAAPPA